MNRSWGDAFEDLVALLLLAASQPVASKAAQTANYRPSHGGFPGVVRLR